MTFPQFPDDSNETSSQSQPKLGEESSERYQQARKSAQRLYLILLAIGLSLGVIASIGVVSLLQRFGLTEVPDRVEQN